MLFHSFQEYFCLLLSYRRQCPALRIHQRNHDPLHSLFPLLCEIYPLILAVVFLRPQNKQTFLRHIFQCGIHCLGRVEPIVADLPLGKRLFFPFLDTIQNPESRLRQITVFCIDPVQVIHLFDQLIVQCNLRKRFSAFLFHIAFLL